MICACRPTIVTGALLFQPSNQEHSAHFYSLPTLSTISTVPVRRFGTVFAPVTLVELS